MIQPYEEVQCRDDEGVNLTSMQRHGNSAHRLMTLESAGLAEGSPSSVPLSSDLQHLQTGDCPSEKWDTNGTMA